MKKSILITGGFGFIGINLIQHLLKNTTYSLKILSRRKKFHVLRRMPFDSNTKRLKIIYGSILDKKTIKKVVKNSSMIIHLAGITNTTNTAESLIKINIIGTTLLLEESLKSRVTKIILFSSSGIYSEGKSRAPFNENYPLNPYNFYSASKLAIEKLAYVYHTVHKLPIVLLRPFNVYGPYQSKNKPMSLFITNLLQDKKIILNYEGKPVRDWLYIDDLISAIEKIMQTPDKKIFGEIFNVATGKGISIRKVADKILLELNKGSEFLQCKKGLLPEPMYNVGDSKKIQNMLEWRPKYSIDKGIQQTVEWYKKNKNER